MHIGRNVWPIRHISFDLPLGFIGVLGPNGAGKSVLLRCLATVFAPSEGSIKIDETNIWREKTKFRAQLGYAPQSCDLPAYATAVDVLRYCGALRSIPRSLVESQISELANKLNMRSWLVSRIGALSGGMRRRLLVAQALLGHPETLLLDEPSAELDITETQALYSTLAERELQTQIVVSTHNAAELENFHCYLLVLDRGTLAYKGSSRELLERFKGRLWSIHATTTQLAAIGSEYHIVRIRGSGSEVMVWVLADAPPQDGTLDGVPNLELAYSSLLVEARANA